MVPLGGSIQSRQIECPHRRPRFQGTLGFRPIGLAFDKHPARVHGLPNPNRSMPVCRRLVRGLDCSSEPECGRGRLGRFVRVVRLEAQHLLHWCCSRREAHLVTIADKSWVNFCATTGLHSQASCCRAGCLPHRSLRGTNCPKGPESLRRQRSARRPYRGSHRSCRYRAKLRCHRRH